MHAYRALQWCISSPRLQKERMASPILRLAPWARGKYDVYSLSSDGANFTGYIFPPGCAFMSNPNQNEISDHIIFFSTRSGRSKGKNFICAASTKPFSRFKSGSIFPCSFIMVLGLQRQFHPPMTQARLIYLYRKWKGHLGGYSNLKEAFFHLHKPHDFVTAMFSPELMTAFVGELHIRPLNQICGPSIFQKINLPPSFAIRYGTKWHQISSGGDIWENGWYQPSDKNENLIRAPSTTSNVPTVVLQECVDKLGLTAGCRNIFQYQKGTTMVIYTLIQFRSYGDSSFIWLPLPNSPPGFQDFALLYTGQKKNIDNTFRDMGPQATVDSYDFRLEPEEYCTKNIGEPYIRVPTLTYGDHYLFEEVVHFVVSVIFEDEIHNVEDQGAIQVTPTVWVQLKDKNQHDCFFQGVVVARFSEFPKKNILTNDRIQTLHETFPTNGLSRGIPQFGGFQSAGLRQSNTSNRSMGAVSPPVTHHYYDERNMDPSLLVFASGLLQVLYEHSVHAQEPCGQVMMGIIKSAYKTICNLDVTANDICPYLLFSHPIKNDHGESVPYYNVDHLDSKDHVCDLVSHIVQDYVDNYCNEIIQDYLKRVLRITMERNHKDSKKKPKKRIPLPTTCPWKLLECPEKSGWGLLQYFVMTEAGVAWNLSSSTFMRGVEILRATFFGCLCGHVTSAPIWINLKTGGVTTICPGPEALAAWGSSGGYAYTNAAGPRRDTLVVNLINNYMNNNAGALPRRIPGVRISDYVNYGRNPNQVNVSAPERDCDGNIL